MACCPFKLRSVGRSGRKDFQYEKLPMEIFMLMLWRKFYEIEFKSRDLKILFNYLRSMFGGARWAKPESVGFAEFSSFSQDKQKENCAVSFNLFHRWKAIQAIPSNGKTILGAHQSKSNSSGKISRNLSCAARGATGNFSESNSGLRLDECSWWKSKAMPTPSRSAEKSFNIESKIYFSFPYETRGGRFIGEVWVVSLLRLWSQAQLEILRKLIMQAYTKRDSFRHSFDESIKDGAP